MNVSFRHHGRTIRGQLTFPGHRRGRIAAVLLVHGRGVDRDCPTWLVTLRKKLVRQGLATLAIDLSGHGASDGQFEDTTLTKARDDVTAARDFLAAHPRILASSIAAVGHSLGGLAIFVAQAERPIFKELVVVAAPLDNRTHLQQAYPAKLRKLWKQEGRLCFWSSSNQKTLCLKYSYLSDRESYDLPAMAADIHQPILLIEGSADRIAASTQTFRALGELKERVIIRGGNHNFDHPAHQRQLVRSVSAWMKRYLQPRIGRSVVVMIRHQGKILSLKRSQLVWFYPGAWAVVGGHLPHGADPVEHAFVEIHEEIGYKKSDLRVVRVGPAIRVFDPVRHHTWVSRPILMEVRRRKRVRLDWEHTAARWIDPKRFPFHRSYHGAREQFKAVGLQ